MARGRDRDDGRGQGRAAGFGGLPACRGRSEELGLGRRGELWFRLCRCSLRGIHPRDRALVRLCARVVGVKVDENLIKRLTVPVGTLCRHAAKASQPTMRAISCTSAFVSRAFVSLDRSCESFARTHGWVEMWTFDGRDPEAMTERGGRREVKVDYISLVDHQVAIVCLCSLNTESYRAWH